MSLIELELALAQVLTDADYLARFLVDKKEALAGFELSPAEIAAITGIDDDRLRGYSNLLLRTRIELGLRAFPRVRKLLGPDFVSRYGAEYARTFPLGPASGQSPVFVEFRSLLTFLEQHASRLETEIPFFGDTLQYDATMFVLGNDPDIANEVHRFERHYRPLLDSDDTANVMPLRSPGTLIRTFTIDILSETDRQTSTASDELSHLLFYKTARDVAVRLTRVNDATKCALELCDGRTPIHQIADGVARQVGLGETVENVRACIAMCQALSARGVIGVRTTWE